MSESRTGKSSSAASADLRFRVRSLPIAKPRQSRRDRFDPSLSVQLYRAWADLVRLAARQAYMGPGWAKAYAGPVALACTFMFPIPASWSKKKQAEAAAGLIFHTSKPDLSNLLKAVEDPLSGVIWTDDRQVVEYREPCWKRYGRASAVGAYVDVWFLEGPL